MELASASRSEPTVFQLSRSRRTMKVRPLISSFYNSAKGYAVVGYQNHSGTSLLGDLTSYTGPAMEPNGAALS